MKLKFNNSFINKEEIDSYKNEIERCHKMLHEGTGEGSDFIGWVNLKNDEKELQ